MGDSRGDGDLKKSYPIKSLVKGSIPKDMPIDVYTPEPALLKSALGPDKIELKLPYSATPTDCFLAGYTLWLTPTLQGLLHHIM